jgi:hypothetical protein
LRGGNVVEKIMGIPVFGDTGSPEPIVHPWRKLLMAATTLALVGLAGKLGIIGAIGAFPVAAAGTPVRLN